MKKLTSAVTLAAVVLVASLSATTSYASIIFGDDFSYADGPLTNAASWTRFGGSDDTPAVTSEQVSLGSGSSDVERGFTEQTGELFFSLELNVASSSSGATYAFGFRDGGALNGGRFWLDGTTGGYNIGVSVDDTPGVYSGSPTLLGYGLVFRIVGHFDGTDQVSVWVDPLFGDQGSPEISTTSVTVSNPDAFFIRQGDAWDAGGSSYTVDNLVVGTEWSDVVVPEPSTAAFLGLAGLALLAHRRRKN